MRWVNANNLVAVATLITSVVTCKVALNQTELSKMQWDAHSNEIQPAFDIKTIFHDTDSDEIVDTETLLLNLCSGEVKERPLLTIHTFLKLNIVGRSRNVRTLYVPISNYYSPYDSLSVGMSGTLLRDSVEGNYGRFFDFRMQCLDRNITNRGRLEADNYECEKKHFFVIRYVDKAGQPHTLCYDKEGRVDMQYFSKIDSAANRLFSSEQNYGIFFSDKLLDYIIRIDRESRKANGS